MENNYALSEDVGRKLFGIMNKNIAMPESVRLKLYNYSDFFNTDKVVVNADKVTFYGLETPDVSDNNPAPGDCEGAEMICTGSTMFEYEIKRPFDKIYQFDTCRIEMGKMNIEDGRTQLTVWQRNTDRARLLYEIQEGIKIITTSDKVVVKNYQVDGSKYVNVVESLEDAVSDLQAENPMVALNEYHLLVSQQVQRELNKMKIACCDFLQGTIPAENSAQLSVRTTAVPTSWLQGQDYILYIQRFVPYHHHCYGTKWINLANTLDGWIGYHIRGIWDVNVINPQPEWVKTVGYKGKVLAAAPAPEGKK